jgi:HK97 gp10 family phage protein
MGEFVFTKWKGLEELGENMRRLEEAVNKKIAGQATAAGAEVIVKLAKQKAPVADAPYKDGKVIVPPGNVGKNVIKKKLSKSETSLTSEHIVTVRHKGAGVVGHPYRVAIFNEFGTVKMKPQSFMRPAFDEGKSNASKAIIDTLAEGIEKAAGQ